MQKSFTGMDNSYINKFSLDTERFYAPLSGFPWFPEFSEPQLSESVVCKVGKSFYTTELFLVVTQYHKCMLWKHPNFLLGPSGLRWRRNKIVDREITSRV